MASFARAIACVSPSRATVVNRSSSRDTDHRVGADASPRRRDALACFIALASGVKASDANAGDVLDGLVRYRDDAQAAFDAAPEDEVLRGQLNFFNKQVEKTRANAAFLSELAPRVEDGLENYTSALTFSVRDVEKEIDFWTKACGMRLTSDVGSGTTRVATLAYGQTSLYVDDGGKAAIVIKQSERFASGESEGEIDGGNVLSYLQITVPFGLRVSQIYESGGDLLYGFGYFDMRSPGGIPVRGQVATRRDPLEVVALNVKNVREAEKALVAAFGYVASKPLDANKYAPKSPPGSRLLAFTSPSKTLGILLQPSREKLRRGDVFDGVDVVGARSRAVDPVVLDGVPFAFAPLDESLARRAVDVDLVRVPAT